MPSLRELEGKLLRILSERTYSTRIRSVARAQGVFFLCPRCFTKNRGPIGTHGVICWFLDRGVPADLPPLPGRWVPAGNGLADLTFIGPSSASVQLLGGCNWHGFVRSGEATLS